MSVPASMCSDSPLARVAAPRHERPEKVAAVVRFLEADMVSRHRIVVDASTDASLNG